MYDDRGQTVSSRQDQVVSWNQTIIHAKPQTSSKNMEQPLYGRPPQDMRGGDRGGGQHHVASVSQ
jgi:hypothetical protein